MIVKLHEQKPTRKSYSHFADGEIETHSNNSGTERCGQLGSKSGVDPPKATLLVLYYSGPVLHLNFDGKFATTQKNFNKGNYLWKCLLKIFFYY